MPKVRFERTTQGFSILCSTPELSRLKKYAKQTLISVKIVFREAKKAMYNVLILNYTYLLRIYLKFVKDECVRAFTVYGL